MAREKPSREWPDFYDPDSYEQEIGPGGRIAEVYASLAGLSKQRVAEFGCGPGQVILALAERGHEVTGIERSASMAQRARMRIAEREGSLAGKAAVVEGDVSALVLSSRFDQVLLTNEFVLHFMDTQALVSLLSKARSMLVPDGTILLDLPVVDLHALLEAAGSGRTYCRGFYPASGGTTLKVTEHVHFDAVSWRKDMTFEYEEIDASGASTRRWYRRLLQRAWTRSEIALALQAAGCADIQHFEVPGFPGRVFFKAGRGHVG